MLVPAGSGKSGWWRCAVRAASWRLAVCVMDNEAHERWHQACSSQVWLEDFPVESRIERDPCAGFTQHLDWCAAHL